MQSVRAGRALVPEQHRVHPPHQRPRLASTTCSASSSTPATSCWASATSTSARRSRRRSIRAIGWSPPSTTPRAPGRRRTRSASAAPTCASTAWKGPGGYQFVGRTVQMWNRYRQTAGFPRRQAVAAALLRPDPLLSGERGRAAEDARGLSARPVSAAHRGDDARPARLPCASSSASATSIAAFKARQQARVRSRARALARRGPARKRLSRRRRASATAPADVPEDCVAVTSPVTGSVWQIARRRRASACETGDALRDLEAMKMEIAVVGGHRGHRGRRLHGAGRHRRTRRRHCCWHCAR